MLDIKKNINKKKMLANITFILFLCTSDFFFYTPQCLIDSVSYPVSPHDTFFFIWFRGMQDWHSDCTEKIGIHNKGLKIRVFSPPSVLQLQMTLGFQNKIICSLIWFCNMFRGWNLSSQIK